MNHIPSNADAYGPYYGHPGDPRTPELPERTACEAVSAIADAIKAYDFDEGDSQVLEFAIHILKGVKDDR